MAFPVAAAPEVIDIHDALGTAVQLHAVVTVMFPLKEPDGILALAGSITKSQMAPPWVTVNSLLPIVIVPVRAAVVVLGAAV